MDAQSVTAPGSSTGIILFAHGSRDPLWHQPMEAVAAQIRQRQPATPVSCAYLELSTPALPDAAAALVAGGVTTLRIFPVFLGVGRHAREDLPALVAALRLAHPGVAIEQMPAAGEHAALISLLADIAVSA
ncbi:MAG: CbiX/SirB N-terminal domain-containing protein [Polaromonas sp.]|nr:CbiX/SirB N-terminal domain-containing protein [Polaromonas sp.]